MIKPICIILARSGSKGLPNKNVLYFQHKPLVWHTIEAAINSEVFDLGDIILSSDSSEYLELCAAFGISLSLRPIELSGDDTSIFDVVKYILERYPDNQPFILLQPTSPFRTSSHVKESFDMFTCSNFNHIVSCVKADKPKVLYSTISDGRIVNDNLKGLNYKRQDYDEYLPNGAIYISTKNMYLEDKGFFSDSTGVYVMDKKSSLDLEDLYDFRCMLGLWYFDYSNRKSLQLNSGEASSTIVLGDSRYITLEIAGATNFSVGGIGLYSAWNSKDNIDFSKCKLVHFGIGLNDVIVGFSYDEIIDLYNTWFTWLSENNISAIVYSIGYGCFRQEIDNNLIAQVNETLCKLVDNFGFRFVDINHELSENGQLKYMYSADGMHYTKEGLVILKSYISEIVA